MRSPLAMLNRLLPVALIAATAAIAVACGGESGGDANSVARSTTTSARATAESSSPMLDVSGIAGWINSEPVTIADLTADGNVVLVDFWTYTCVNCLRTLPFLRDWYDKYSDRGLVILGVHAPEFEFEKNIDNVRRAVEDEMVRWPVALDNDMSTWRRFGNRYWPAKYLISHQHELEFSHFGEGAYVEMEEKIREALIAAGHDVSDIPLGTVDNSPRDPDADRVTREIYGGYERNYSNFGQYAGQENYYIGADRTQLYVDAGLYTPQQFYLEGRWTNSAEAVVHARETEDLEDYIALHFVGRSANVVIDPQGPEPFDVFVTIDDQPLAQDEAGDDVIWDDQGRSYFTVTESRMYRFLEVPEFGEHVIKLASNSDNFAIFAFTFGVYDGGF